MNIVDTICNMHSLWNSLSFSNGNILLFVGPESDHCLPLSFTNSLTHSLPFSKLDWCDPGMWRWQLKTCYCLAMLVTHWLTDSLTQYTHWLTHSLMFSRLDGYEWYQLLDVFASATESCEKVETSCVSCPPQLVKVIKLSTASKSADNLKVVGNFCESKLLVCWQDTNQSPNPPKS